MRDPIRDPRAQITVAKRTCDMVIPASIERLLSKAKRRINCPRRAFTRLCGTHNEAAIDVARSRDIRRSIRHLNGDYPVSGRSALATKLFAITTHCSLLATLYHLASSEPLLPEQHRSYENSGKAMPRSGVPLIFVRGPAFVAFDVLAQVSPEAQELLHACGCSGSVTGFGGDDGCSAMCGRNPLCTTRRAVWHAGMAPFAFTLVLAGCAVGPDYVRRPRRSRILSRSSKAGSAPRAAITSRAATGGLSTMIPS